MNKTALLLFLLGGLVPQNATAARGSAKLDIRLTISSSSATHIALHVHGGQAGGLSKLETSAEVRRLDRGRWVVFFPGAGSKPVHLRPKTGPVAKIILKRVRRGTVAVFTLRSGVEQAVRRPRFRNIDGRRELVFGRHPRKLISAPSVPVSDGDAADVAAVAPTSTAEGRRPLRAPLPTLAANGPTMSPLLLAVTALLGLLALLLWLRKRQHPLAPGHGIDLVSVMDFGGKTKLAVVEACGERLLVAASDAGVQMLSRIGDQSDRATGPRTERPMPEREFAQDLAHQLQAYGRQRPAEDDLAGLLALRRQSQAETKPAAADTRRAKGWFGR